MDVEIIGGPRDGEIIPVPNGTRNMAFARDNPKRYVKEEVIEPQSDSPMILRIKPHPTRTDRAVVYWPR